MNNKELFLKFILPLGLTVIVMMSVAFLVVGGFLSFLGEEQADPQSNNRELLLS